MKITFEPTDKIDDTFEYNVPKVTVEYPTDSIICYEFMMMCAKMAVLIGFHPDNVAEFLSDDLAEKFVTKSDVKVEDIYSETK